MPGWANSDRRDRLPRDWHRIRQRVKARAGGICEYPGCLTPGNQCDHIIAGDDHSLQNLQWLCARHHRVKSSSEGGSAPRRPRRRRGREPERHPGLKY